MEARDERGQFAPKFEANKQRCDFRLSPFAVQVLDSWSKMHNCSKTDLIEKWLRGELDSEIITRAINNFVEDQRDRAGGNQHKQPGILNTGTRDWRKLREFKEWIEDEIN